MEDTFDEIYHQARTLVKHGKLIDQVSGNQAHIAGRLDQVEDAILELADLPNIVRNNASDIHRIETVDIGALHTDLTHVDQRTRDLPQQITNLHTRAATNADNIAYLYTRLETAEAAIKILTNDMISALRAIDHLRQDIETLERD